MIAHKDAALLYTDLIIAQWNTTVSQAYQAERIKHKLSGQEKLTYESWDPPQWGRALVKVMGQRISNPAKDWGCSHQALHGPDIQLSDSPL